MLINFLHDRMPVVLPDREEETWLEAGPDDRRNLCQAVPRGSRCVPDFDAGERFGERRPRRV